MHSIPLHQGRSGVNSLRGHERLLIKSQRFTRRLQTACLEVCWPREIESVQEASLFLSSVLHYWTYMEYLKTWIPPFRGRFQSTNIVILGLQRQFITCHKSVEVRAKVLLKVGSVQHSDGDARKAVDTSAVMRKEADTKGQLLHSAADSKEPDGHSAVRGYKAQPLEQKNTLTQNKSCSLTS